MDKIPLSMGFLRQTLVGCHFFFQRIFLIQRLNPHLLHWQVDSLPLSHQGSPILILQKNIIKYMCKLPESHFLFFALVVSMYPVGDGLVELSRAGPGSSIHGILQARVLQWVAIPFSSGYSWPRDQTCISCASYIAGRFFTRWAIREAQLFKYYPEMYYNIIHITKNLSCL